MGAEESGGTVRVCQRLPLAQFSFERMKREGVASPCTPTVEGPDSLYFRFHAKQWVGLFLRIVYKVCTVTGRPKVHAVPSSSYMLSIFARCAFLPKGTAFFCLLMRCSTVFANKRGNMGFM